MHIGGRLPALKRFLLVIVAALVIIGPLVPRKENASAVTGIWKGKTYNLSDGQIYGMTHMAKNEQGSVDGIKFELSLMANKAEKDNRSDIVDYIRNSSWFASSTRSAYNESKGSLSDAEVNAAKDVLVNGNRVLPPQILEHDCIGDISWIELDGQKHYASNPGYCRGTGLKNSAYFVSGKTKIHNKYGSTYIFYTFPVDGDINSGDPFGYFEGDTPSEPDGGSSSSNGSSSKTLSDEYRRIFSQNNIIGWDPRCVKTQTCTTPSGSQITWIGDSYSVGAESIIKQKLSGIDFGDSVDDANSTIQSCKFVSADTSCNAKPTNPSGLKVLQNVIDSNKLKPYLVFAVGTNGGWSESDVTKFKEIMAGKTDTKVVFVTSKTPGNDFSASNKLLKELADSSENYYLADWTTAYSEKYFDGDAEKIHPVSEGGYEKWVETIVNALPQNCSDGDNTLPGDSVAAKIWNYLVSAVKSAGLQSKNVPAVVAGIMGNFYVESGLNPLMKGASDPYYGLYMLYGDYGGNAYVSKVNSALGANYFKFYGWWSDETTADTTLKDAGLSTDQIDQAIKINIDTMTSSDNWTEFINGAKNWGVADTAKGYSDLMLVTIEGAVGGSSSLEDAGVKKHYSGNYQDAAGRRDKAQYFYDKYADSSAVNPTVSSTSASSSSSSSSASTGKNYAGDVVWDENQLAKVEKYKSVYQTAAKQYGIPWQAIASMHRLENSLSLVNDTNGQGLYQLYSYTNGGKNSNAFPAGEVDMDEFQRQTNIAASQMKSIIESGGQNPATDAGIKYLIFSYNGMSDRYKQKALDMGFTQKEANVGEGSPYVMNRYDARRDPTSSEMDPHWPGRYTEDQVYTEGSTMSDFGGFVLYTALGGGSGNTGDECEEEEEDNSDLISYIKKYAWPEYHAADFVDRMTDYATVVSKRLSAGLYVGGSVHGVPGIDCGGFVTTVMQESGFDSQYNLKEASNVSYGQLPYIRSHSDVWQLVNPSWGVAITDESQLSPGDIAFSNCSAQWDCGHTYLYIGEVSGFETHIASASYGVGYARAPMSGRESIVSNGVNWFHKVK